MGLVLDIKHVILSLSLIKYKFIFSSSFQTMSSFLNAGSNFKTSVISDLTFCKVLFHVWLTVKINGWNLCVMLLGTAIIFLWLFTYLGGLIANMQVQY